MISVSTARGRHPLLALEEHAADPFVEEIILATDGGPAGAGATRWVAHRSKMHTLNVEIGMVVELDWLVDAMSGDALNDAAEEVVRAAKDYLARTAPSAEVQTAVTWGEPRERFERASEYADLIVVGTNRGGRLTGMLGSTFPVKLAEGARCPAIVVPKSWRPSHGPVVVGIQGDDHDDPALTFAIHEARVLHRELRIVHSWTLPAMRGSGFMPDSPTGPLAEGHEALLERVLEVARAANPDLEIRGTLVQGDPSDVLLQEAADAELLVVGSHGWTTTDRLFLGSVSRAIISRPPCAVAIVRPRRV